MAFYAEEFGKAFIFKKVRPKIRGFFLKAGYDDVPYELFGWLFYGTLVVTYFMFLFLIYGEILWKFRRMDYFRNTLYMFYACSNCSFMELFNKN